MKLNLLALAITLAFQQFALAAEDHIPKGYKLLYEQTFENPDSIQQFQMTDANAKLTAASLTKRSTVLKELVDAKQLRIVAAMHDV